MAQYEREQLDHDPLTHLDDETRTVLARHENAGGCFTIIGPISICWKVIGGEVEVCLMLAGIRVACARVNPTNPCVTLAGNVLLAKASIKVCLERTCLTYDAEACYRETPWHGWKCVRERGTIVCF